MEAPHVKKHLPLITARIEFSVTTTPKPPMITPRMDLGKRLKLKRDPSISDDEERTPKRRRQSFSPAHDDGTDVESLSSLSDITSEDESASANYTMLGKVPKPPGEAGRPGSGGYNLEERLGWPKKEYDEMVVSNVHDLQWLVKLTILQKYIHEASKRELEISKSFKQQKTSIIDKICKEVSLRAY